MKQIIITVDEKGTFAVDNKDKLPRLDVIGMLSLAIHIVQSEVFDEPIEYSNDHGSPLVGDTPATDR